MTIRNRSSTATHRVALALLVAVLAGGSWAATQPEQPASAQSARNKSPYASGMANSARMLYAVSWGVDQLRVRLTESGQLVRFDYRVMDATKAAPLNDKTSTPYVIDEASHAVLHVPDMENIGKLRQAGALQNGVTYSILFSNKGGLVKPGDRVSVVIGPVRLDGIPVR